MTDTMIGKTTRQVNASSFTDAMTKELERRYLAVREAGEDVRRAEIKALAVDMFKDVKATRRIIGKLGTMSDANGLPLYRPYEQKTVSTKRGPTRAELRLALETILDTGKGSLCSFDRTNSKELALLIDSVKAALSPSTSSDEVQAES